MIFALAAFRTTLLLRYPAINCTNCWVYVLPDGLLICLNNMFTVKNQFAVYFLLMSAFLWCLKSLIPEILIRSYSFAAGVCLFAAICYYPYLSVMRVSRAKRVISQGKAVFITGCDTGFGHELAKRLDAEGYHVFAGCLFPGGEGANALREVCSTRLRVVGIDVTNEDSVSEALDFVNTNLGNLKLWALVNNAGIAPIMDVGWGKTEQFELCMDVNTFGPVRITKAFLPLLVPSHGRVINVASVAGRMTGPHLVAYAMSKFAVVAFSESLRHELEPSGVKTISIEPESFNTQIAHTTAKLYKEVHRDMGNEAKELYNSSYFEDLENFHISIFKPSNNLAIVIKDIYDAVSLESPQLVYRPSRSLSSQTVVTLLLMLPNQLRSSLMLWLRHGFNHS